ncbi:MAG: CapA family protein [Oscillospiraceae bacterium]|jgi:poly-gamma-glutamate capsule biosynthesis protein CapA/YwtB (metallophosphatase superfamily)|nr:CapA family protein [Oscillospiraceae bacterium]
MLLLILCILTQFTLTAGAQEAVSSEEAGPKEMHNLTIGFLGNIEFTQEQITAAKQGKGYNLSPIFNKLQPYLDQLDYTTAFLGNPIAGSAKPIVPSAVSAPEELAAAMSKAGIKLAATACEGCYDYGEAGLLNTISALDKYGIQHVGTAPSSKEQKDYVIEEINGVRLAFFSFTYGITKAADYPFKAEAKPYVSLLDDNAIDYVDYNTESRISNPNPAANPWQRIAMPKSHYLTAVSEKIEAVRKEVDFIIVMAVFPENESFEEYQKTWADTMVRAGADFIVANTKTQVKPFEYKVFRRPDSDKGRRTVIFSSIGNATLNMPSQEGGDAGVMFIFNIGTLGELPYVKATQYVPLYIDKGQITPIYRELKFNPPEDAEKNQRMQKITSDMANMYLKNIEDKAPKYLYTVVPYVGNSQLADDVGLYSIKIYLSLGATVVILAALISMALQIKKLRPDSKK